MSPEDCGYTFFRTRLNNDEIRFEKQYLPPKYTLHLSEANGIKSNGKTAQALGIGKIVALLTCRTLSHLKPKPLQRDMLQLNRRSLLVAFVFDLDYDSRYRVTSNKCQYVCGSEKGYYTMNLSTQTIVDEIVDSVGNSTNYAKNVKMSKLKVRLLKSRS